MLLTQATYNYVPHDADALELQDLLVADQSLKWKWILVWLLLKTVSAVLVKSLVLVEYHIYHCSKILKVQDTLLIHILKHSPSQLKGIEVFIALCSMHSEICSAILK